MFDKRIKLFDYQEEIAHDSKKKMLLMDAGTGKTFTALRRAQLSWCPKLLVICLAPKVTEWQEDIMTFAYSYDWDMTRDTSETLKGQRGNDKLLAKGDTIKSAVASYESVARIPQLLKWVDDDTFVIIDESHKVKNSTSKINTIFDKFLIFVMMCFVINIDLASNRVIAVIRVSMISTNIIDNTIQLISILMTGT